MGKFIFCCASNFDRSPLCEKHFREKYPQHEFRSAGINKYHTGNKGTHYLTQEDIEWADMIIYAENVHRDVAGRNFKLPARHEMICAILDCGHYERGSSGTEYLSCAEAKLMPMLMDDSQQ